MRFPFDVIIIFICYLLMMFHDLRLLHATLAKQFHVLQIRESTGHFFQKNSCTSNGMHNCTVLSAKKFCRMFRENICLRISFLLKDRNTI